jgi:hypothetical protein
VSCREFERALDEVLATGAGSAGVENPELWRSLEGHVADCADCAELLELARLPRPVAAEVAEGAITRTSGSACRQAEAGLNQYAVGESSGADSALLAVHLEHCRACAGLVEELELLSADLPRLARVQPETSLVAGVLRRTLPWPVRARRWWAATWPVLVRRPRFAVEFSFALTLVLVVIFGTPGSPLQAMPERAVGLVRSDSFERLEAWPEAAQGEITSRLLSTGAEGKRWALGLMTSGRTQFGTIRDEVASWFVTAENEPPAQDQPNEE